jgi:hypothetical protein
VRPSVPSDHWKPVNCVIVAVSFMYKETLEKFSEVIVVGGLIKGQSTGIIQQRGELIREAMA